MPPMRRRPFARLTLAVLASLGLASGCLGDLGLFAGDEGDVAQGGTGAGGVDGGGWPDSPNKDVAQEAEGEAEASVPCSAVAGALKLISPECPGCMTDKCCAALEVCAGSDECLALVLCALSCTAGDTTCFGACTKQHPTGVDGAVPIVECATQSCRNACARCGGLGSLVSFGKSCDTCARKSCCQEGIACGKDPACFGYAECWTACPSGDAACTDACAKKFPGGATTVTAAASCLTASCASASCRPCGGLAVTFGKSAECGACIEKHCCAPAAACANDPACVGYIECIGACPAGDTACAATCGANFPKAKPKADALSTCLAAVTPACPC